MMHGEAWILCPDPTEFAIKKNTLRADDPNTLTEYSRILIQRESIPRMIEHKTSYLISTTLYNIINMIMH